MSDPARSLAPSRQSLLWLSLALLAVLTLVAVLSRPLTPLDETRYVGVAWEMWLRGDFLVPYKNGAPYDHKPPLMIINPPTTCEAPIGSPRNNILNSAPYNGIVL